MAAAIARSAEATSGRRSSTSDGTPSGTAGGVSSRDVGASENDGAGVPVSVAIACSNCAALAAQHVDLRQRGVEQRLLLRDVEARGGAEVVARA